MTRQAAEAAQAAAYLHAARLVRLDVHASTFVWTDHELHIIDQHGAVVLNIPGALVHRGAVGITSPSGRDPRVQLRVIAADVESDAATVRLFDATGAGVLEVPPDLVAGVALVTVADRI
ncbi:hypothetical protein [Microbacterium sp. HJ5]